MLAATERDVTNFHDGGWVQKLSRYRKPNAVRGGVELAVTTVPFALAWVAMFLALYLEQFWLYALLLLPAAGFLVRLFMIQHDCGHGSDRKSVV